MSDPTRCAGCGAIIAQEPGGLAGDDAELERILAMSDEEIIAEARRDGLNPELEARYLRKLVENAVEMVRLRERAEKAERHYMAAVYDRMQFRTALRRDREHLREAESISEGRRRELERLEAAHRAEWQRAERAEAERDALRVNREKIALAIKERDEAREAFYRIREEVQRDTPAGMIVIRHYGLDAAEQRYTAAKRWLVSLLEDTNDD